MDSDDPSDADPQLERLFEYLDSGAQARPPAVTAEGRERVLFISTENGDDLVLAYAIETDIPGAVVSLILQRTPKFERLLPPEERGVTIMHEFHSAGSDEERDRVVGVVVEGPRVDIEAHRRTYQLDVSEVEAEELKQAQRVLRRMHQPGGFALVEKSSG